MSFEVHAGWCAHGLAGGEVEPAVVLWAFDQVVHHESAREVDFRMRAQAIGGVVFVIGRPVDGKRAAFVIETQHILLLDITRAAGVDPILAHRRSISGGSMDGTGRAPAGSWRRTKWVGSFICFKTVGMI